MEPFDLERAKAGDPIGWDELPRNKVHFIGEWPENDSYVIAAFFPYSGWDLRVVKANALHMKPKPIRFWVRPWKGASGVAGVIESRTEFGFPMLDDAAEWVGEAKLVEWP